MSDEDPWVGVHSWQELIDSPFAPPKAMHTPGPKPHFHANRLGVLEACYHRITAKGYATGLFLWTISFPFEHYLWLHAPGFRSISHWMGL